MLHLKGFSQRQIALELGISRNTVSSYVKEYDELASKLYGHEKLDDAQIRKLTEQITEKPKYNTQNRRPTKYNQEIDELLDHILLSEKHKTQILGSHKQALTNAQIHQLIVDEGYDIGLSTINAHIKQKRALKKEAYIAQTHPLGKSFEFDFGEIKLVISGKRQRYYLAVLTAPATQVRFAKIYEKQTQEVVMDAHIKFFEFCGGVFEEGVYDNLRQVVTRHSKKETVFNERFLAFANYYGFHLRACNVRSGNEKGFTERSVEIIRNAAFACKYSFKDLKCAEEHLSEVLEDLNKDKALNEERSTLKRLKPTFEISEMISSLKVDKLSCVTIYQNKYSVPDSLVGQTLYAKVYPKEILIYKNSSIVARHERSYEKGQMCLDIYHYLDTLSKKPGALESSYALECAPQLKSVFDFYYKKQAKEFIYLLNKYKHLSLDEQIKLLKSAKSTEVSSESCRIQSEIDIRAKEQIELLCKVVA